MPRNQTQNQNHKTKRQRDKAYPYGHLKKLVFDTPTRARQLYDARFFISKIPMANREYPLEHHRGQGPTDIYPLKLFYLCRI